MTLDHDRHLSYGFEKIPQLLYSILLLLPNSRYMQLNANPHIFRDSAEASFYKRSFPRIEVNENNPERHHGNRY
jgi:hypothetical protein